MADELTINLDPVSQTGLTITAKLIAAGAVVASVALVEGGSGYYHNTAPVQIDNTHPLPDGVYSVDFVAADGHSRGGGSLRWSSGLEVLTASEAVVANNNSRIIDLQAALVIDSGTSQTNQTAGTTFKLERGINVVPANSYLGNTLVVDGEARVIVAYNRGNDTVTLSSSLLSDVNNGRPWYIVATQLQNLDVKLSALQAHGDSAWATGSQSAGGSEEFNLVEEELRITGEDS